ncbi:MAG TPA: helix-hairpin-helix domain-containing protein [Acidobacteriota bacterium]|nr:helix-hairpin-helix domain-containing protein [Acidobacteriota bacterium]
MRSDYALYMVAIIFFVITGISAIVLSEVEQSLWVVTTAVLGLLFAGLGYSQRPRPRGRIVVETPPSTSTPVQAPSEPIPTATAPIEPKEPVITEVKEENIEVTTEPTPAPIVSGLTEVKGIGEKRKQQLNTLGINSINDLAMTSADELAQKLKISPKITGKWIENAKKLLEKS